MASWRRTELFHASSDFYIFLSYKMLALFYFLVSITMNKFLMIIYTTCAVWRTYLWEFEIIVKQSCFLRLFSIWVGDENERKRCLKRMVQYCLIFHHCFSMHEIASLPRALYHLLRWSFFPKYCFSIVGHISELYVNCIFFKFFRYTLCDVTIICHYKNLLHLK